MGTVLSLVAVFGIVALLFVLVVSGVQLAGLLEDYAPHMAFVVWTSIPGGKAADQLTNLWRHDGCSRRVHKTGLRTLQSGRKLTASTRAW